MPVTPWDTLIRIAEIGLLIERNNRAHVKEFDRFVEERDYQGGRTAFITEDGTQYDLGGPDLVYVHEENNK